MNTERVIEVATRTCAIAAFGLAALTGAAAFAPETTASVHFAVEGLVDHNLEAMSATGREQVYDQILEGYTSSKSEIIEAGAGALGSAALCMALDFGMRRNRQE